MEDRKGLFIVYSGNGKGKTTAAIGLAIRAIGHGQRVRFIQFIKARETGEYRFMHELDDRIDICTLGRGFIRPAEASEIASELHGGAAAHAWNLARETILSGNHDLVVLDERTYAIDFGFVDEEEVLETIDGRPDGTHVVVTGRGASELLIRAADLVTRMCSLKHPMESGIHAQAGIEY